jgi:hypothetical protein
VGEFAICPEGTARLFEPRLAHHRFVVPTFARSWRPRFWLFVRLLNGKLLLLAEWFTTWQQKQGMASKPKNIEVSIGKNRDNPYRWIAGFIKSAIRKLPSSEPSVVTD